MLLEGELSFTCLLSYSTDELHSLLTLKAGSPCAAEADPKLDSYPLSSRMHRHPLNLLDVCARAREATDTLGKDQIQVFGTAGWP